VILGLAGCGEPELGQIAGGTPDDTEALVDASVVGTSFTDLDVDGDGLLSAAETEQLPELRSIFSLADQDQDGALNVSEFSHATIEGTTVSPDAARGPLFLTLDTDRNARISRDEARAVPQLEENFETFDVNRSEGIDSREYADALDEGLTPAR
jgi:Ca2+-binding EF-hand superfamily protein